MQPQDPMIDFYNRLYDKLNVNIPEAFMRGQAHAAGIAESKSRLATDKLRQREMAVRNRFLPEQLNMQREQFGMAKQSFANEQELFGHQKNLWPYQEEDLALTTQMKKFEAEHMKDNYDFNRMLAKAELGFKQQEMKIRAAALSIESAKTDVERSKATQNYVKQFNDYSKNAATYAALAAKYRTNASTLLKGDMLGGPPSPTAQAQAAELMRIADGYAKMASVFNTQASRLFPDLAPSADMYRTPMPASNYPSVFDNPYPEEEEGDMQ
jgi:hypothetical protein